MDNNSKSLFKPTCGLMSMCITLAATAIVIQDAYAARAAAFASDEPLPCIMEWLSPLALIFLGAGYLISAAVAFLNLRK